VGAEARLSRELKYPLSSYVDSLWSCLFDVARLNARDPVRAYKLLLNVVPLLPEGIFERVKGLLIKKSEAEEMKEALERATLDSFTSQLLWRKEAREELRRRTWRALREVSRGLEEMGLKYRYATYEVGGELVAGVAEEEAGGREGR